MPAPRIGQIGQKYQAPAVRPTASHTVEHDDDHRQVAAPGGSGRRGAPRPGEPRGRAGRCAAIWASGRSATSVVQFGGGVSGERGLQPGLVLVHREVALCQCRPELVRGLLPLAVAGRRMDGAVGAVMRASRYSILTVPSYGIDYARLTCHCQDLFDVECRPACQCPTGGCARHYEGLSTRQRNEAAMAVDETKLNEFLGKAVGDLGAAMSATLILVGDRLGLYRELAKGAMTSAQLAQRTGTDERYVREWLGNQGAGGYVRVRPRIRRVVAESGAGAVPDRPERSGRHARRIQHRRGHVPRTRAHARQLQIRTRAWSGASTIPACSREPNDSSAPATTPT